MILLRKEWFYKDMTQRNILIAFILNLAFSVFEIIGGFVTGSVAIISDAVHDMGDALSIGVSYFLERKSKKQPDETYTYGYIRYSVMGSLITTIVLMVGSAIVIYNAVIRILNPVKIDYKGMIVFAVIGAIVNFIAAYFTKDGDSLNQKAVNLHMLEDVLGWIVVLIGAIIMNFTDISYIDPVMSICVALFIFKGAFANLKKTESMFLEKITDNVSISGVKELLLNIEDVIDVHHIHIWSIDGFNNYATMHIVTRGESSLVKKLIREKLKEFHIIHVTLELEDENEECHYEDCHYEHHNSECHHHHHHHHHH